MPDPETGRGHARTYARVLGRHGSGRPGPTVVVTGGVHGNEPAGCEAMLRVLATLERERLSLRGELWGVAGNLRALAAGRRYLDRDLNRRWIREDIARIVNAGPEEAIEDHEQLELLELFAPLLARARAPIVFFDLHSTSGPAAPFSCMADVLRNRGIALALPLPVVLGLEEVIDGSLLGYLCDLGHIGVAVEGGQHDDPDTIDAHESALWIMLVAAGALEAEQVPALAMHRQRLAGGAQGLPAVSEIRHRHIVRPEHEPFVMLPGFDNFQAIMRGQLVAHDARGPVHAPIAGRMMLPRYQGLGDDGYFVAAPVSPLALQVSAALRWLQLDRLVPLLPGIRRHPERPDHFIADPQVARSRVVEVFHLFGYRHVRIVGPDLVFARRAPGVQGVHSMPAEVQTMASRAGGRGR
ncbi:MAG: succinylglutamate desuccinylase/aspartoacylase family protein [Nannocystis sp.]|nr:succinylglutamate desuccinylase/aspartoacylase family protein [Nannocystis sp.]MBA3550264.1 succinylglutamate desuccinylase/aspartoacylase family protein [Nannocystis sp.]